MNAILRWLYVELARWCKVFGQGDTALRFYKLALELRPDDAVVIASVGFELARQGRKREALAWFDRAVAARPDYAEGHFDRGFLLQELNDPEAAMDAFDRALAIAPDHDRALYGKALCLIGKGRLDEAVAPLERNTKVQPFSPYGWYQLGRVQFDRGKPEKTQAIIEHLVTFEPKVAAQLARETGLRLPAS
jgi:tetratricopeptide (TPR) repeat protein